MLVVVNEHRPHYEIIEPLEAASARVELLLSLFDELRFGNMLSPSFRCLNVLAIFKRIRM